MIEIIADSICDLPPSLMSHYQLKVLPLHVYLNEQEYRDKVDISTEAVYAAMRQDILPKTSHISLEDTLNQFSACAQNSQDFIYPAFSAALSGSCDLAKQVVQKLKVDYPHVQMAVIDTRSGAAAQGLITLQAVRMSQKNAAFADIVTNINHMAAHVEHIFSMEDLNWLTKGGRIPKIAGKGGSILNIHPLLHVDNGAMKVIGAVRGSKKQLHTLCDTALQRLQNFPDQLIAIAHADDYARALEVRDYLSTHTGLDDHHFLIQQIGSVLATHLGLKGLGIFFFNERPPYYDLLEENLER